MKTSESIADISKALCEAQKKINHATKDAKNPHFKNDYASLESVIDASKIPLLDNGISVIQSVNESKLVTRLQHSGGQFFESELQMIISKQDMQGLGSAITYARRYSLASMLNISQADDDGNSAAKQQRTAPPQKVLTTEQVSKVLDVSHDIMNYRINAGPKNNMTGTLLTDHTPQYLYQQMIKSQKWHNDNKKDPHSNTKELWNHIETYLRHVNFEG